jgi:hypothetical protein
LLKESEMEKEWKETDKENSKKTEE